MDEKIIVALMSVFGYIIGQRKNKSRKTKKKLEASYWRIAAKLDIAKEWEYEF